MKEGALVFILGFVDVGHGKKSEDISSGGIDITGARGQGLSIKADGAVRLFADSWASLSLEKLSQSIFGKARDIVLRTWTGRFSAKTNDDNQTYEIYLTKALDKSALPSFSGASKSDDLHLEFGALDINAIVRWSIGQNYDALTRKAGVQISGWLGLESEYVYKNTFVVDDVNVEAGISREGNILYSSTGPDRSVSVVLSNASTDNVAITVSGTDYDVKAIIGSGDNAVSLIVGENKCALTIDKDGNVTVATADGANIKLGGMGMEQPLVTESWVNNIFANHTHMTASPGAPTAPPTPLSIPVSTDAKTNPFTFTTKAE